VRASGVADKKGLSQQGVLIFTKAIKLVVVMSAVETWKSAKRRPELRQNQHRLQVADCENRGNLGVMDAGNASQQISVHKRAHEIRTLRKRSAQVLYRSAEAPRVSAQPIAQDSETGRHWGACPLGGANQIVGAGSIRYCRASINRVMVRFRSLSDRRISSILWIECSTVVWCLPPN